MSHGLSEGTVDYHAPELRGASGIDRCGPLAESVPNVIEVRAYDATGRSAVATTWVKRATGS